MGQLERAKMVGDGERQRNGGAVEKDGPKSICWFTTSGAAETAFIFCRL